MERFIESRQLRSGSGVAINRAGTVVDASGRLLGILRYDDLVEWVAESVGSLGRLATVEPRRERERR